MVFNILDVFQLIGIPVDNTDRKLERMAKACLAVGKIKKDFSEACSFEDGFTRTRDIITFENKNFGEDISSGSYDDIRRQDLKLLVEAGIVVNSSSTEEQATNNPSRGYGLSISFTNLLHSFGSSRWEILLNEFRKETKSLKEELERHRDLQKVPVRLPCRQFGYLNTFDNKNQTRFADIAIQDVDLTKVLGKDSDPLERNPTPQMHRLGFAK